MTRHEKTILCKEKLNKPLTSFRNKTRHGRTRLDTVNTRHEKKIQDIKV